MSEITDAEAIAIVNAARAEAIAQGQYELPPSGFAPLADFASRIPAADAIRHERPVGMWEPACVTVGCGQPLGYTAKEGSYGAVTICKVCRAGDLNARLRASGISEIELREPLSSLTVHSDEFRRYMEFLKKFAALKPRERLAQPFAFVYGSNGVGKSAGAQRALRDAITNGCQGRFITLQALLWEIYDTYGSDHSMDMRAFFSSVHLLVIDSVGHEDSTPHSMACFFELVNNRHRNSLPTIFEGNYAPTQASLGAAQHDNEARSRSILDRIRGGCGDHVYEILGKSRRSR